MRVSFDINSNINSLFLIYLRLAQVQYTLTPIDTALYFSLCSTRNERYNPVKMPPLAFPYEVYLTPKSSIT